MKALAQPRTGNMHTVTARILQVALLATSTDGSSHIEGLKLVPFATLRAAKLTCLLSRAEPRSLVDVLFLERSGYLPEEALPLALFKDAGVAPFTLAWLVRKSPMRPMPIMLVALTEAELALYLDALASRFKRLALEGE